MAKKEIITSGEQNDFIIYHSKDGKVNVALMTRDGNVWLNQQQIATLFATSVPNICMHITNVLKEGELDANSVIKNYLTTATDGKKYEVTFYSLENGAASDETDAELTSLEDAVQKRNKK